MVSEVSVLMIDIEILNDAIYCLLANRKSPKEIERKFLEIETDLLKTGTLRASNFMHSVLFIFNFLSYLFVYAIQLLEMYDILFTLINTSS